MLVLQLRLPTLLIPHQLLTQWLAQYSAQAHHLLLTSAEMLLEQYTAGPIVIQTLDWLRVELVACPSHQLIQAQRQLLPLLLLRQALLTEVLLVLVHHARSRSRLTPWVKQML